MDKNIKGLTDKEVQEQIELGNINKSQESKLKTKSI